MPEQGNTPGANLQTPGEDEKTPGVTVDAVDESRNKLSKHQFKSEKGSDSEAKAFKASSKPTSKGTTQS